MSSLTQASYLISNVLGMYKCFSKEKRFHTKECIAKFEAFHSLTLVCASHFADCFFDAYTFLLWNTSSLLPFTTLSCPWVPDIAPLSVVYAFIASLLCENVFFCKPYCFRNTPSWLRTWRYVLKYSLRGIIYSLAWQHAVHFDQCEEVSWINQWWSSSIMLINRCAFFHRLWNTASFQ